MQLSAKRVKLATDCEGRCPDNAGADCNCKSHLTGGLDELSDSLIQPSEHRTVIAGNEIGSLVR